MLDTRPYAVRRSSNLKYKAKNRERLSKMESERRIKFPLYKRARHRVKRYGITPEEYDRMYEEQGGVCAICKEPEKIKINGKVISLSVDHCHDTNKVRRLLCSRCNGLLGFAKDSILILESAIRYLQEHGK